MTHLTDMSARHATDRLADWQTALRAENKSPGTVAVYADGATRYLRWWAEGDHLPMSRAALNQWQRARTTAPAFAVGWMVGITIVIVVVLLVAGPDGVDTTSTSDTTYWIKLGVGVVFLLLALVQWRKRPKPGQPVEPPKWMATLDHISPVAAAGLGAALSAANPKNLALAVTGAVAIVSNDLSSTQQSVCVIVFVVIASVLVTGPVVAHLVAGSRMATPLDSLKGFMQDHNIAIMVVLLSVLGLSNLDKGLGGLLS